MSHVILSRTSLQQWLKPGGGACLEFETSLVYIWISRQGYKVKHLKKVKNLLGDANNSVISVAMHGVTTSGKEPGRWKLHTFRQ